MNGRNGRNGTIFPVRKSRGFFYVGEPGFRSRSSREKQDFILPLQEVLFVGNNDERLLSWCGVRL